MIRRGCVPDLRRGTLTRAQGYLVVTMCWYPRFVRKEFIDGDGAGKDRKEEQSRRWRVNYDSVLIGLAVLTMAPKGLWSSDRVSYSMSPFVTAVRKARRAAAAALAGQLDPG